MQSIAAVLLLVGAVPMVVSAIRYDMNGEDHRADKMYLAAMLASTASAVVSGWWWVIFLNLVMLVLAATTLIKGRKKAAE